MNDEKYFDIGDANPVRMTDKQLGRILRATIRCGAKIVDTYETNYGYKNPNMNPVLIKVCILEKNKKKFEEISGVKLSKPPIIMGT